MTTKKSKPIKIGAADATIDAPIERTAFDGSWSGPINYPHSARIPFSMAMRLFNACGRQYEWRQVIQAGKLTKIDAWDACNLLAQTLATSGKEARDKLARALAKQYGATAKATVKKAAKSKPNDAAIDYGKLSKMIAAALRETEKATA